MGVEGGSWRRGLGPGQLFQGSFQVCHLLSVLRKGLQTILWCKAGPANVLVVNILMVI